MSDPLALQEAWNEAEEESKFEIAKELVEFYLYDWGYLSPSFYDATESSRELLLAMSWLFARHNIFQRARMRARKDAPLPPYPETRSMGAELADEATALERDIYERELKLHETLLTHDDKVQHLHLVLGQLKSKLYVRC